jgi:NhaA family Na+:H+ antiporter
MMVPALLYSGVNLGGPGAHGWGIPMATDIAFAFGVLAILGDRVPSGLRVFLAALAIGDDLGAVLVIAFAYTSSLDWAALGGAVAVIALLVGLGRAGARHPAGYLLLGVPLWLFILASGIHATVAGVLLAFTVPAWRRPSGKALLQEVEESTETVLSPLQRMEHSLQIPVAYVIMPLFALANAGVTLGGAGAAARSPIALGVALGLLLGKPLGVTLASFIAVRTGAAELPAGVTWRHVHGAGWLAGIGFTMSLFVAQLAFPEPAILDLAKIGVLTASCVAGATGFLLLRRAAV